MFVLPGLGFDRFFVFAPAKKKNYIIPYGYVGLSIVGLDDFMKAGAEAEFLPPLFTHTANLDRGSLGKSIFAQEFEDFDVDAWSSEIASVVAELPASEHELGAVLSTKRVGEWPLEVFLNPFSPGAAVATREFSAWCAARGIAFHQQT